MCCKPLAKCSCQQGASHTLYTNLTYTPATQLSPTNLQVDTYVEKALFGVRSKDDPKGNRLPHPPIKYKTPAQPHKCPGHSPLVYTRFCILAFPDMVHWYLLQVGKLRGVPSATTVGNNTFKRALGRERRESL